MIGKAADLAQARGWEHEILSTLSVAVAIPSPRWRKNYNAYIHCSIDGAAWGFVLHKEFEVMSGRESEVSLAVHRLGHVDKWRSQSRIDVMSMKPRKLSAVLS